MNISTALLSASFIGHGPATPNMVVRVIMFVLGILFVVVAFARDTRVRGAFSHGKGPSIPINTAGRVILGLIALVMFSVALGILR